MRTRVVEVLTFQIDGGVPAVRGEILGHRHRCRAACVAALKPRQLSLELRIPLSGLELGLQLAEGGPQGLRNEGATEPAEMAAGVGL